MIVPCTPRAHVSSLASALERYASTPTALPEGLPVVYADNMTWIDDHVMLTCFHDQDYAIVKAAALAVSGPTVTVTSDMGDLIVPKSYKQAMASPHSAYWRDAINSELTGLVALNTWEVIPRSQMPAGANLLNCHFIFAVKRREDGSLDKFKARLVADGSTQQHGIDFDKVFATVVKTLTIRLILAIATARDYNLSSIDIRQAYLQAFLGIDIFMRIPPGLHTPSDSVCKLKRSLYGLKQAGRDWATLFASFLTTWGMRRSHIDVCLYTYEQGGSVLWILIYVDDALIADNDLKLREKFVRDLSSRFPTEDKGALTWILNVAVRRERKSRCLHLSQELYVDDLLMKYGEFQHEEVTKRFDSPLEEGVDLSPDHSPQVGSSMHTNLTAQRKVYMSVVGGLLWLANMTRPDIAYAASQLSRVLTNPGPIHIRAVSRVLIYLRHTKKRTLTFKSTEGMYFKAYVDSNWSAKFSCSGAMMFVHGCLFHWFSKMQRSVTLSSAEAEFFGAMLTAREIMFVRELLIDLGIKLKGPTPLYCDSKSAVEMSIDPISFKKTKHILRAAEFLKDLVLRLIVEMQHLPGRLMIADILTKACARVTFIQLMHLLDDKSLHMHDDGDVN